MCEDPYNYMIWSSEMKQNIIFFTNKIVDYKNGGVILISLHPKVLLAVNEHFQIHAS